LLILDEPTVGLDPNQVVEIRDLVRNLRGRATILLSTHILSEAAALGQRVLIMHRGRLVANATPERLALAVAGTCACTVTLRRPSPDVVHTLTAIPGVLRVLADGDGRYLIETGTEVDRREEIATLAVQQGWGLLALSPLTTPLEETFLRLIREAEETPP
jgi:ABC-2 type transport system ATP-binding protein